MIGRNKCTSDEEKEDCLDPVGSVQCIDDVVRGAHDKVALSTFSPPSSSINEQHTTPTHAVSERSFSFLPPVP